MSDSSNINCTSSNFCKLFGELAISYNGLLVDCVPDSKSRIVGTILTVDGKIFTRDSCEDRWELIITPAVFAFYDNKSSVAYEVNTCKKSIHKFNPHGRILDCTDKKIYEIKDDQWCPVCDLNCEDDCEVHVGAGCGSTLTPVALSNLYRTCTVNAADLFYSYPVNATPAGTGATGVFNYIVGGLSEKNAEPSGQIVGGNSWVAPASGDYDFHAVVTYLSSTDGLIQDDGDFYDNFLLVLTRGSKKAVLGRVPVNYDSSVVYSATGAAETVHYYVDSQGQAVFDQGLRLLKGDALSIYLVSHLNASTTVPDGVTLTVPEIYTLDPLGTTLDAHLVAEVDDCDVPAIGTVAYTLPILG